MMVFLSDPIDNSRFDEVEFTIPTTGTMHGFAGFFEAKLYKDITISKSRFLIIQDFEICSFRY